MGKRHGSGSHNEAIGTLMLIGTGQIGQGLAVIQGGASDMSTLSDPGVSLRDVVPSNTTTVNCKALLVTIAGDLVIETFDGGLPSMFPVTAGQVVPIRVAKVKTGTTATVKAIF